MVTITTRLFSKPAPDAKAIQELVGHSTLTMTLRYMHLAPSALREAIGLLDDFGQQMGNARSASV